MEGLISVLQIVQVASIAFLGWFIKAHVVNRVEKHAQQYGEIDAKIERLPDLTRIETALKESHAKIELQFKEAIEDVLQGYRVRLALTQKLIEKKLDIYQQLLQTSFELYRGIAKISTLPSISEFAEAQDQFYILFTVNGLYLSPGTRRAAEMFVAILTDLGKIGQDENRQMHHVHTVRERSRLVVDLLRVEIASDLNGHEFLVSIPTREQREAWIAESNNIELLKTELETKSGTPVVASL